MPKKIKVLLKQAQTHIEELHLGITGKEIPADELAAKKQKAEGIFMVYDKDTVPGELFSISFFN